MNYYFVVNETKKTFNVFDEDNLEYIEEWNKSVAKITGEDNVNEVTLLIYRLRPDLEKAWPHDF